MPNWRRTMRGGEEEGAGTGPQARADVFDAVQLLSPSPASPIANTLYKGAGRWVEIERKTASASSSLDFVTGLDGRFDLVEFEIIGLVPVTDNVDLYMRVSEDGGATWKAAATDYTYTWGHANSGPGTGAVSNIATASAILIANSQSQIRELRCHLSLAKMAGTNATKRAIFQAFWDQSGGANVVNFGGGSYKGTNNAINGVRFVYSSGNIAEGKIICSGRLNA